MEGFKRAAAILIVLAICSEASACLLRDGPVRRMIRRRVDAKVAWYVDQVMSGKMDPSQIPRSRRRGPIARYAEQRARYHMQAWLWRQKPKRIRRLKPPKPVVAEFPPPITIPGQKHPPATWEEWERMNP